MADVGGPPDTLVAMSLRGALPWTLIAAAGLVSVEALVECVVVAQRDELTPGLRAGLVACIALKGLAAWRILHRSAGAALLLLLLEATTVVAAFGAVDASTPARLGLGASALTVLVLVAASLHAFPSPELPSLAAPSSTASVAPTPPTATPRHEP